MITGCPATFSPQPRLVSKAYGEFGVKICPSLPVHTTLTILSVNNLQSVRSLAKVQIVQAFLGDPDKRNDG